MTRDLPLRAAERSEAQRDLFTWGLAGGKHSQAGGDYYCSHYYYHSNTPPQAWNPPYLQSFL